MGAISILGGALAAGDAGIQAQKGRDEVRRKKSLLDQQEVEDIDWYNRNMYQDLSRRTEMQEMFRQLQDTLKREQDQDEAQSDVVGSTSEQRLAKADSRNKVISNTLAGAMRDVSALRDNWNLQNLMNKHSLTAQMLGVQDNLANIHNQWAANLSTAASGAMQSGGALLGHGMAGTVDTSGLNTRPIPNETIPSITPAQGPNAQTILDTGLAGVRKRNGW